MIIELALLWALLVCVSIPEIAIAAAVLSPAILMLPILGYIPGKMVEPKYRGAQGWRGR
jgi:hypothetical protein